jgi:pyrimidine-specific ribonucleoside hydrolase
MMPGRRRLVATMIVVPALFAAACAHDDTRRTVSAGSTTIAASRARVPMVVDTDLAADDIVALYYLLSAPTVRLLAVTVSGTGEVTCPRGVEIAARLLTSMRRSDVPVACGRGSPLSGHRAFPSEWRAAAVDAYGLSLPTLSAPPPPLDADQLIADAVHDAGEPITLLTLGPLTDVAGALDAHPGLGEELAGIVIMGGALHVSGNVQPDGASAPLGAEWNLYIDPDAAATVLGSGAAITLVPLDATNAVPVPDDLVDRLEANDRSEATSQLAQLLTASRPPFLWDPLAAIAAADPVLVPRHRVQVRVLRDGDEAGRTIEDPSGSEVLVADHPDAPTVIDHLLRTVVGAGDDEPLATPTTIAAVGAGVVRFDGTSCTYDGPSELPRGSFVLTVTQGAVPYQVAVAHLIDGTTVDEALAWATAHPGERPPMVDSIVAVGEGGLPSPATVELLPGTNPIVCATGDGVLHLAAQVTVHA